MGGYMDGWRSKRPLCDPSKKPLFFIEKMLRLLEIFLVKNSSPFFSKLVRVRGPNHYILLIGTIKPYNICYWHFLLRSFLSEIFNDPFHQTKKGETNKTVYHLYILYIWRVFIRTNTKHLDAWEGKLWVHQKFEIIQHRLNWEMGTVIRIICWGIFGGR